MKPGHHPINPRLAAFHPLSLSGKPFCVDPQPPESMYEASCPQGVVKPPSDPTNHIATWQACSVTLAPLVPFPVLNEPTMPE